MPINVEPTTILLLGTNNGNGTYTGVTTGSSRQVSFKSAQALVATAIGTGTITGGTVLIESAYVGIQQSGALKYATHYDGTWTTLQSITATDVTGTGQKSFYILGPLVLSPGYLFRARVSSDITGGGTISIVLGAQ